ncbi:hypothetical protein H0H93_008660 [Arthromyces matolae]|nr:hypothetical protein H0H93_008660 [Arthromyces matolae]
MNVRPLITVCGTTGVGKSSFAIDLALHLSRGNRTDGWRGARIINADSMQVYRGMDVITNKVTEKEQQGVKHTLMDFKSPEEQYTVGEWVQDALQEIHETHQHNEIPIIVGGTAYWMQHLIFPNRLAANTDNKVPRSNSLSQELVDAVDSLDPYLLALFNNLPKHPPSASDDPDSAYSLHSLLALLDPVVANRWHWKDTRKVLRSLNIIKETGQRPSEIMLKQAKDLAASYKQFHAYLSAPEPSETLLAAAIEHMKLATRQYAKRQVTWIRNKLLPAVYAANTEETTVPIYLLDATEQGAQWNKNVRDLDFLASNKLPDPSQLSERAGDLLSIEKKTLDPVSVLSARQKRICDVCTHHPERPFMVEEGREWDAHRNTRVHRRLAAKARKT